MKLRSLLIASCVLFSAGLVSAQSASDPVSGTWKGFMGPGTRPQFAVTLDLKLAGSDVSGTLVGLPSPGDVKKGSFDEKTGAINLQLGISGESVVRLVLEGTVVKDMATGRVSGDNQAGTFMISKVISGSSAQQPAASNVNGELQRSFGEVSDWVSKAADMVPAEKYNYRPVETVRTFGQLIGHVTDSYIFFCARGSGKQVKWSDATEKGATDKATLVPKLKQALEGCNAAYGSGNQIGPLIDNVGHTNLHYGNIITYMRMMGMKPPSS